MIYGCEYRVSEYERSAYMSDHAGAWIFGGAPYGLTVESLDGLHRVDIGYSGSHNRANMIQCGIAKLKTMA